jgi:hypothetical protein
MPDQVMWPDPICARSKDGVHKYISYAAEPCGYCPSCGAEAVPVEEDLP